MRTALAPIKAFTANRRTRFAQALDVNLEFGREGRTRLREFQLVAIENQMPL